MLLVTEKQEKLLTTAELSKLNTKRLLQYYKKIRKTTSGLSACGCGCGCAISEIYDEDTSEFQTYLRYNNYRIKIKKILDKREHVERKH